VVNILLVEDDLEACRYIAKGLEESGHSVDVANDGESGLALALSVSYDVIILDRMLPKLDGMELLRLLREQKLPTPVLILSALGDVDDRVEGLQKGGDDYLVKPYAFSELLARLMALSRRTRALLEKRDLQVGAYRLDRQSQKLVHANGRSVDLQPQEVKLLEILMTNAGRVVTRSMLLEHVWDLHFSPQSNVVDTQVCRLRNRISGLHESAKSSIETVRGSGYRFLR